MAGKTERSAPRGPNADSSGSGWEALREEILGSYRQRGGNGDATAVSAIRDEEGGVINVTVGQDDPALTEWLVERWGDRMRILSEPGVINAIAPAPLPPHRR